MHTDNTGNMNHPPGCVVYPRIDGSSAGKTVFYPSASSRTLGECVREDTSPRTLVLDTCIWLSLFSSRHGGAELGRNTTKHRKGDAVAKQVWEIIRPKKKKPSPYTLATSDYIREEICRVLRKALERCKRHPDAYERHMGEFLGEVDAATVKVEPCYLPRFAFGCLDEKDLGVLGTAITARAGMLMTMDHHLHGVRGAPGLLVLRPEEFCKYYVPLTRGKPLEKILGCPTMNV